MDVNGNKLTTPMIAGALIVIAIIAGFISYRLIPRGVGADVSNAPSSANSRANEEFFRQKARECQGELSRLSPQDQQEIIRRAGGPMNAMQALRHFYSAATP